MIVNNKTTCGIDTLTLPRYSRKKVLRICDSCQDEKELTWQDYVTQRQRHNRTKDYCFKCAMRIYNSGDLNASKRPEVAKKISLATRGISKKFTGDKNPKICDRKITTNGYVDVYDQAKGYVKEHRQVIEIALGRELTKQEQVHHIDGNKQNNQLDNLVVLSNSSEHTKLHKQLEALAMELYNKGIIKFDKEKKLYYVE